jgi:hypothetical protein
MKKFLVFTVIFCALMACSLQARFTPTVPPNPISPTPSPQPTDTPQAPAQPQPSPTPENTSTSTPSMPCQLTAIVDSIIYQRPSAAADVFGTLTTGESVQPTVRTSDGFFGFEPGVAQAGNVGVFRNRWILKNYQISAEGDCSNLPVVIGPIANLCYAMVMLDAPVYTSNDSTSDVLTTLKSGDYAMVLESSADWVKVDLNVSNLNISAVGWINLENIGYNGKCEALSQP